MMNENSYYKKVIEEALRGYTGQYQEILGFTPALFELVSKIYPNSQLDWESKIKLNCCLAYFAVPEDVMPDSNGPEGYLDDLFICAYTLNELIPQYKNLLISVWEQEKSLLEVISLSLEKTTSILNEKCIDILNFAGLSKFTKLSEDNSNLSLFEKDNFKRKVELLNLETLDLLALLRMIITQENPAASIGLGELSRLRIKSIKSYFNKKEWESVVSLLEKVEIHDSKFMDIRELEDSKNKEFINQELNKIRRKVLLNIEEAMVD